MSRLVSFRLPNSVLESRNLLGYDQCLGSEQRGTEQIHLMNPDLYPCNLEQDRRPNRSQNQIK
jgi:hypothetical protein